jgi:diacylglycerol kinase (ATP)
MVFFIRIRYPLVQIEDIFLLINPHSGKKNSENLIHLISNKYPALRFVVSRNQEEAQRFLLENIEKYTVFIIAGGDGTINQVIPFFTGRKDKALCVYPMGSGNGFAYESGFVKNFNSLIGNIQKGETVDLDVLKCNDRYSVNVAGIGLDGYIADLFVLQKSRGFIKYITLTIKALLNFSPFQANIRVGQETIEGTFLGVTLANTRQFGNHAYIAPNAKPNDGKIDLVVIRNMPFFMYIPFFFALFAKKIASSKYIYYTQSSDKIIIDTSFPFAHTDGEPFTISGKMEVKILPSSIRIIKTGKFQFQTK